MRWSRLAVIVLAVTCVVLARRVGEQAKQLEEAEAKLLLLDGDWQIVDDDLSTGSAFYRAELAR